MPRFSGTGQRPRLGIGTPVVVECDRLALRRGEPQQAEQPLRMSLPYKSICSRCILGRTLGTGAARTRSCLACQLGCQSITRASPECGLQLARESRHVVFYRPLWRALPPQSPPTYPNSQEPMSTWESGVGYNETGTSWKIPETHIPSQIFPILRNDEKSLSD